VANLNKAMLIGRLCADPEPVASGKGAKIRFAVSDRKFNKDTQQWEDAPVFLDLEVWNRGDTFKLAERVLQTLHKGQQIFIEGHLKLDQWEDKNGGGKRSKLVVVVDNFQYLEPKASQDTNGATPRRGPNVPPANVPPHRPAHDGYSIPEEYDAPAPPSRGGTDDDVPF
jgi:single-strand DNA-binding protein